MQIQCSSNDEFIVGQNVECSCTSYLDPIFIEWYQGNTSLQQSFVNTVIITIPVTTDNEGSVFTCLMTSFWGTYQKMLILNTTGMLYHRTSNSCGRYSNCCHSICYIMVYSEIFM